MLQNVCGTGLKRDLTASRSVEENIKIARRSFFHYGALGAFQGDLNLLSTGSVVETCVMPVLMYESENWSLMERCFDLLVSFLGEIAKRALKWPKHFSKSADLLTTGVEGMHSRLLTRKLGFLRWHLVEEASGIGTFIVTSMLDDPDSLCIVQECRDLEEEYGTKFTYNILADADAVIIADIRK